MTSDAANKYEPGVAVEITAPGDGKTFPIDGDNLVMHYVGTFYGGSQHGETFDSSRAKKKPFKFQIGIGRVIAGWDVGVKQFSLGARGILKIGYDFGYGERGYPGVIPPKQDLRFDVELLAINSAQSPALKAAKLSQQSGNSNNSGGGAGSKQLSKGVNVIVTKPGDGKTRPKSGQKLSMHYVGTFLGGKKNGQKFDSSRDRGKPFEFVIGRGQVIKGWDEGILQLTLGSRAILEIRADYGYGARGYPPLIPGNQNLRFDVEVLAIK